MVDLLGASLMLRPMEIGEAASTSACCLLLLEATEAESALGGCALLLLAALADAVLLGVPAAWLLLAADAAAEAEDEAGALALACAAFVSRRMRARTGGLWGPEPCAAMASMRPFRSKWEKSSSSGLLEADDCAGDSASGPPVAPFVLDAMLLAAAGVGKGAGGFGASVRGLTFLATSAEEPAAGPLAGIEPASFLMGLGVLLDLAGFIRSSLMGYFSAGPARQSTSLL